MKNDLSSLEQNINWQATAKQNDGKLVAIMRGEKSGPFEGKFYLYAEDWNPFHYPPPDGMVATPLAEIKSTFSYGELTLVRGSEPQ